MPEVLKGHPLPYHRKARQMSNPQVDYCKQCKSSYEHARLAGKRMRTFEGMARTAREQIWVIGFALDRLPGEDDAHFKRLPSYMKDAIRDARNIVAAFSKPRPVSRNSAGATAEAVSPATYSERLKEIAARLSHSGYDQERDELIDIANAIV